MPTYAELADSVRSWTAPLQGPKATGISIDFDPDYEWIDQEVAKLNSPSAGVVDWPGIAKKGAEILEGKSKDFVVATFLAHALHRTEGLAGLSRGVALLAELMELHWEAMYPEAKKIRRRANALQWFLEKSQAVLVGGKEEPGAPGRLEGLVAGVGKLSEVARSRFKDATPAMGPIQEAVERLRLAAASVAEPAPAQATPEPPTEPPPAGGGSPAVDWSAAPQPPSPAAVPQVSPPSLPAPPDLGSVGVDPTAFLQSVGDRLIEAAATLRAGDVASGSAARLLRVGLWLHLDGTIGMAGPRTQIPAPPESLRSKLQVLHRNQQWLPLIEEAESAAARQCFWLDLHRMVWQAHSGLGPAHERAREAVAAELLGLRARIPRLPELAFSDGTPFADPATRAWLTDMVGAAPATPASARSEEADPESEARTSEGRKLLAQGKVTEGLQLLMAGVVGARTGRAAFCARLALAQASAAAGLHAVAKSMFEELDRESLVHGLDRWEPMLAVECLVGLVAAARALGNDPRGQSSRLVEQHARLCRLDPAAAHAVWP